MPLPSAPFREQLLSGWGGYPRARCRVHRPERDDLLPALAGLLPRGLGRAYGDAALDPVDGVVSTERLDRLLAFDPATGLLEAEAGASLGRIGSTFLDRGWFLPVTPGTKFVTLGGAVAGDVHGKNHHVDGSFSRHVAYLDLVCPTGERIRCSEQERPDLFHATAGGMGLTGLIAQVGLRLAPVPGPWVRVTHHPSRDLEQSFRLLGDPSIQEPYSVAWIDCLARGARLGRSVLMVGEHVAGDRPSPGIAQKPRWSVPFQLPSFLLNSLSLKAFNEVFYRLQAGKGRPFLATPDAFFYPLDKIDHWNRMYGSAGFLQYQCVLPERTALEGTRVLLERISAAGAASFLAVLKRLGPGGPGHLSFPMAGYTLALDLPFHGPRTLDLLRRLDEVVALNGGRVNLCKDACLDPATFRTMYPRFGEWLEIKRRVDPGFRLQSGLSRRLRFEEGA